MQRAISAGIRSRTELSLGRSRKCFSPVPGSQILRTLVTKRYTPDHEAIVYDDTTRIATVHITEHAQKALGDVVFVELMSKDTVVDQGMSLGAIESVKSASDIFAPVSGTIKEINENLASNPGLLNKSAEDKGWLCRIEVTKPEEMEQLLSKEAYTNYCS